jgi:hypothetical protein
LPEWLIHSLLGLSGSLVVTVQRTEDSGRILGNRLGAQHRSCLCP